MPKPVTPMVGCDAFVLNGRGELLLVRRSDNGLWALPGGCQELDETASRCAARECLEESGYRIRITRLLGTYSSINYEYRTYPWKENVFCHLLFAGSVEGGEARGSDETPDVGWFAESTLPEISDGHEIRIRHGFERARDASLPAYFD
jgi:ADP-ribose pyrophosphatase YjhB (NUDIX family)